MNDKELADAVVALGIGTQVDYPKSSDGVGFYHTPEDDCGESDGVYSKLFVRDWRVAGALTKMVDAVYIEALFSPGNLPDKWQVQASMDAMPTEWIVNESPPRAIIEACVEALT